MPLKIENDGSVYIYDHDGSEIVSWISDEYEDPSAAVAAIVAIKMTFEGQLEQLKEKIGK